MAKCEFFILDISFFLDYFQDSDEEIETFGIRANERDRI